MKKMFIIVVFMFASCLQAIQQVQVITPITKEAVKKEQERIEKLLAYHKYALYTLGGISTVAAIYVACKYGKSFAKGTYSFSSSIVKWCKLKTGYAQPEDYPFLDVPENMVHAWREQSCKRAGELGALDALQEIDKASAGKYSFDLMNQYRTGEMKAPFLSRMCHNTALFFGNVRSFSKTAAVAVSPFVAGSVFNYFRGYFAHQNSLSWYIGYEAEYVKYCDGIIQSLQQKVVMPCPINADGLILEQDVQNEVHMTTVIEKEILTDDDVIILHALAQDLLQLVKRICAFMDHRMDALEQRRQFAAHTAREYIYNSANTWARDMQDAFEQKDAKKIVQATVRLKADITTKVNMFALLDSDEDTLKQMLIVFSKIG